MKRKFMKRVVSLFMTLIMFVLFFCNSIIIQAKELTIYQSFKSMPASAMDTMLGAMEKKKSFSIIESRNASYFKFSNNGRTVYVSIDAFLQNTKDTVKWSKVYSGMSNGLSKNCSTNANYFGWYGYCGSEGFTHQIIQMKGEAGYSSSTQICIKTSIVHSVKFGYYGGTLYVVNGKKSGLSIKPNLGVKETITGVNKLYFSSIKPQAQGYVEKKTYDIAKKMSLGYATYQFASNCTTGLKASNVFYMFTNSYSFATNSKGNVGLYTSATQFLTRANSKVIYQCKMRCPITIGEKGHYYELCIGLSGNGLIGNTGKTDGAKYRVDLSYDIYTKSIFD